MHPLDAINLDKDGDAFICEEALPDILALKSAREFLKVIYEDYRNNYLTVAVFAEHNGLSEEHGQTLISLARMVYESKHREE